MRALTEQEQADMEVLKQAAQQIITDSLCDAHDRTLRDKIAMAALTGELASQDENCVHEPGTRRVANNCYIWSDAMLAARETTKETAP